MFCLYVTGFNVCIPDQGIGGAEKTGGGAAGGRVSPNKKLPHGAAYACCDTGSDRMLHTSA